MMGELGQKMAEDVGNYAATKVLALTKNASEARAAGNTTLADEFNAEARKWEEGGAYRVALHTVVGGLTGGAGGAVGAGASASAASLLDQLQTNVVAVLKEAGASDTIAKAAAQIVAQGAAAGIGSAASGGNATGAGTALNVDINNRQLHPTETKILKDNAERFAKTLYKTENPTQAQIDAALVALSNTAQNMVDNNLGYDVPNMKQAEDFLHVLQGEYAKTNPNIVIPGSNGQFLFYATAEQKNQPWINSSTLDKEIAGIIIKAPIKTPNSEQTDNFNRDKVTGLPLDDKGRYGREVSVDGKTYSPKFWPCGTLECVRSGSNYDMSDPGTREFLRAVDKKILDDIGHASNVAVIANPVGALGTVASAMGLLSSIGSGIMEGSPAAAAMKEGLAAAATKYLKGVYGLSEAAATRIVVSVDLAGGWQALMDRTKQELDNLRGRQ